MADRDALLLGIGQISLETTDMDRAVTFFRDTLGLTHLFTFPHATGSEHLRQVRRAFPPASRV